jgi:hypothetical protein
VGVVRRGVPRCGGLPRRDRSDALVEDDVTDTQGLGDDGVQFDTDGMATAGPDPGVEPATTTKGTATRIRTVNEP